MKVRQLSLVTLLSLVASLAQPPLAHAHAQASAGITRAEVLADLQVWRSSGLAAFEKDLSLAEFHSREHQAARARYEQMRASPEFHALVQAIAMRRGEVLPQRIAAAEPRTR